MDYLASLTTLPHVSFLNRFAPKGSGPISAAATGSSSFTT